MSVEMGLLLALPSATYLCAMPIAVTKFQPTPNPNALKCIVDKPMGAEIRSFRTAADAAGDPLAAALFALPGVTGLLITSDWLTVSKSPEAGWGPIKAGVKSTLETLC